MSDHAITMSALHTSEREYTITIILSDVAGDEYFAQGKGASARLLELAAEVICAGFAGVAEHDALAVDRLIENLRQRCK